MYRVVSKQIINSQFLYNGSYTRNRHEVVRISYRLS